MAEAIYAPIIIIYLILMLWYSTIMARDLNTNVVILILFGLFFPPLWLILAIASLAYRPRYNFQREKESNPSPKKVKKSPNTKKSKK